MTDRPNSEAVTIYICLIFRTVLVAMLFDVLTPALPLIGADFGVSHAKFQAFFSVALMVSAVILLGAPWLVDHIGRQRSVEISTAVAGLLGLLSTTAGNYLAYAVTLLSMFAANALGSVASRALLRDLVNHERYKKIFAYGQAVLEATSVLAPLAAGLIAAAWGWRAMFAAFCLPLFAVPLLFAKFLPPAATIHARTSGRAVSLGELTELCVNARLPLILLCAIQGGYTTLLVGKPFLLAGRFGFSIAGIGIVLAGFAGVGVLGYVCCAALMSRVAERKVLAAGLCCQCFSALALMYLSFVEALALPLFLAALATAQLGYCLIVPIANAWVMNVATESRAVAAGMLGGLQALSGGTAAFLAAIAYSESALSMAMVCTISTTVAVVTLRFMPDESSVRQ